MKLYFFRHAIAETLDDESMGDTTRKLTKEGIARTKTAASVLETLGVRPARLYTSPLVRAAQTADLLAPALRLKPIVRDELGPGFNIQVVQALVRESGEDDDVLFVGHEPDMSGIVQSLTSGSVKMKKGGLARVDVVSSEPLLGTLVWLIPAKVFNVVGGGD